MNTSNRDYALDQLRGIAAIFMVINHFGYIAFDQNKIEVELIKNILFITSFAPVLFFYTTGYGMGLQTNVDPGKKSKIQGKIVLLFIADFFIRSPRMENIFGLDFFGFIATSVFFVYCATKTKNPVFAAVVMMLIIVLLRYTPVSWFNSITHESKLIDFLSGRKSIPNISYPISPWLFFPLMGFTIAKINAMQKHVKLLFCVGAFFLVMSIWLQYKEWVFFRWGTMSFAFFCASLSILLLIHTLLEINIKIPLNIINLNGVESFFIVPIHYFFVKSIGRYEFVEFSIGSFIFYSALISFVTIFLSKIAASRFRLLEFDLNWFEFFVASVISFTIAISLPDDFFIFGQFLNLLVLIIIGYKFQKSKKSTSRLQNTGST